MQVMQGAKKVRNIDRVLDNVSALKRAIVWAKQHGYEVLSADVTGVRPQMQIETSVRLQQLVDEGAAAEVGSAVINGVSSRIMCTEVEGCRVKWIERGS